MITMVWAREEVSFMFVEAILRFVVPSSIRPVMSFLLVTDTVLSPSASHESVLVSHSFKYRSRTHRKILWLDVLSLEVLSCDSSRED